MSIQKFVPTSSHGGMVAVVSNDYINAYVQYEDYAALQEKLESSRETNAALVRGRCQMDDEIAALQAKLDATGAMNRQQALNLMAQESARIAAEAKLDAVTKDAERYRWLRESGLEIAWNAQVSYSPGYEAGDAEQMDLAIDAAIDRTRSRHITEHQE